jgi:hypothetical protein
MSGHFDLCKAFDYATEYNQAQKNKAGLSPGSGGSDQLSRTHNTPRHNQARAKLPQNARQTERRLLGELHLLIQRQSSDQPAV